LKWVLVRRHVSHVRAHRNEVPAAFRDRIPLAHHQRAADYTSAKARLGFVDLAVSSAILLAWTLGGGLEFLDGLWRSAGLSPLWKGTAFATSVIAISSILDLPLQAWWIFGLEERFGFNRMTVRLFLTDLVKQTIIFTLLGVPMIIVVLWITGSAGALWWLWVWIVWMGFSLAMMWAYPAFIAPWFNKFRPLQDEALRRRIEDLLKRNGFESRGVFVMDGSARST